MSDAAVAETGKKKSGGKKKLIMLLGGVLVLGGGGAAAGFMVAGSMHEKPGPIEDPNKPQLVPAGGNAEELGTELAAKAKEAEGHGEAHADAKHSKGMDMPKPGNPAAYQATYFQIPAPFTSNLIDSDAFAQISIAVSTYYDNRVILAVQAHETAIRSAILMMLAQEEQIKLETPQGKEQLQAKLLKIINDTLKAKTGYGGVDNVYFTNFVIQ